MITINKREDCMGCYACKSICPKDCIEMESDNEGFWYPIVDYDLCIECGLCIKVCPIIQLSKEEQVDHGVPGAFAAYNHDNSTREESSSGGLFTLIAQNILATDGVVFGARFDDDFNVVHDYAESLDDLDIFRGSKYTQSSIGTTYVQARKFLQEGRPVLYTGTPCQISGLKHFLGRDYENLFCQDIICHGVPSPKVWGKYVVYREKSAGSPARRISFRRKDEGWKRYSVSFSFANNTEYLQIHKQDLYMQAFLKDICLRPSCHACHFKTINRVSDITLADFWGIQNVVPELDDDKGTSLVIVHSKKGQNLLNGIRKNAFLKEVDIMAAVRFNSATVKSAARHPDRELFFSKLDEENIDTLIKRLCSDPISLRLKRNFKSTVRFVLVKLGLLGRVKEMLRRNVES